MLNILSENKKDERIIINYSYSLLNPITIYKYVFYIPSFNQTYFAR